MVQFRRIAHHRQHPSAGPEFKVILRRSFLSPPGLRTQAPDHIAYDMNNVLGGR